VKCNAGGGQGVNTGGGAHLARPNHNRRAESEHPLVFRSRRAICVTTAVVAICVSTAAVAICVSAATAVICATAAAAVAISVGAAGTLFVRAGAISVRVGAVSICTAAICVAATGAIRVRELLPRREAGGGECIVGRQGESGRAPQLQDRTLQLS